MDRYLKCVICRYPCIGGQIYMSSQGLAIQIMSKYGYVIFLDCRARQFFAYWGCAGPAPPKKHKKLPRATVKENHVTVF